MKVLISVYVFVSGSTERQSRRKMDPSRRGGLTNDWEAMDPKRKGRKWETIRDEYEELKDRIVYALKVTTWI